MPYRVGRSAGTCSAGSANGGSPGIGPCHELADSYDIQLSDDAIEDHITSYWTWSAGSVLRSRMSVTFTVSSNRSGRRHGPVATKAARLRPPTTN